MTDTRQQLTQLPELAAEAFDTWGHPNPGPRTGGNSKRTRISAGDAPTDLATLDALRTDDHGLLFRLLQCVEVVNDETGQDDWPDETSWTSICGWLLQHSPTWTRDRFCNDWITDEVHTVWRELATLTRQPKPWRSNCRDCPGGIVILVDADGNETDPEQAAFGLCIACRRTYAPGASMRALTDTQPPMPLSRIADLIGIPLRTLHRWRKEGTITPATQRVAGADGLRRADLFDIADVRQAARHAGRVA